MKSLASVLLLVLLDSPTSTGPARASSARYGIPRLAPGQLWVSSVPAGLHVHSGKSPTSQKILGHTPLVLSIRDLDRYVTVTIQKKDFGGELPNVMAFLDFTSRATHSTTWRGTNAEGKIVDQDLSRAITYDVGLPGKQTIIALFQTRDLTPSDLDRLYPPGLNFPFSDQALQESLARKGVPPAYISSGIRLLHRGGKVALPGSQGWIRPVIAEVTSGGRVDLLDGPAIPAK
jgi:hypothetical protein